MLSSASASYHRKCGGIFQQNFLVMDFVAFEKLEQVLFALICLVKVVSLLGLFVCLLTVLVCFFFYSRSLCQ